jgi:Cdc6-like AAA superfamily ATPase
MFQLLPQSITHFTLSSTSSASQNKLQTSKKSLEGLSHNIFLMLQETNKFREHQSREILIELLEDQLQQRLKLVHDLEHKTELTLSLLSL